METLNQDHYEEWRGGLPAREQFPCIQIRDSGGLGISHMSSSDPHLLVVVSDTFLDTFRAGNSGQLRRQICTCTCLLSALLTGYISTLAGIVLQANGRRQLMFP